MRKKDEAMPELMTLRQASEILKCHPNTLRIWDKSGLLKAVRYGARGNRRYKRKDIIQLIEGNVEVAPPEKYKEEKNEVEILKRKLEEQENSASFINEANRLLHSSLDYSTTLQNVAKLIVPRLADWCILDALVGNMYERIAVVHKNPKKRKYAEKLHLDFPPDTSAAGGVGKVLRTGISEFHSTVSSSVALKAARNNKKLLALDRNLGLNSLMIVPMKARGNILGSISFVIDDSNRRYTRKDLKVAQELARQAAIAVDNARLYQEAQYNQEILKLNEDRFGIILSNIRDYAIVLIDTLGRIVDWNEGAQRVVGYEEDEVVGQNLALLFTPEDRGKNIPAKELKIAKDTGRAEDNRWMLKRDGTKFFANGVTTAFHDNKGNLRGFVKVMRDETEQKLAEERKDEFISMASHELKNPVASIKAYTQLLLRRVEKKGDTDLMEYMQRIDDRVDNLTTLITDLLDLTKIRSGKLEYRKEYFDFDEFIEETLKDTRHTIKTHTIEKKGKTGRIIYGDKSRIGQALINLITNAMRYSEDGKKIIVHLAKKDRCVQLGVQDFGIGIAKDNQQKIFDAFYQIKDPSLGSTKGLGIGLFICSEVVRAHQGKIWVESNIGKGSTFYFTLPYKNSSKKKKT